MMERIIPASFACAFSLGVAEKKLAACAGKKFRKIASYLVPTA